MPKKTSPPRIPQSDWPRWSAGFRELVATEHEILECADHWAAVKATGTARQRTHVLRRARQATERRDALAEQLRPPSPADPEWRGIRRAR